MKKNSTIIVLTIAIFILVVLISGTFMSSYAYYTRTTGKLTLYTGNITGRRADFKIEAIYVNNSEVSSMNSVPANYVIDEVNSICYIDSPGSPDANVSLYTNANGEHIMGNFSKSEKCILYFIPS